MVKKKKKHDEIRDKTGIENFYHISVQQCSHTTKLFAFATSVKAFRTFVTNATMQHIVVPRNSNNVFSDNATMQSGGGGG